VKRKLCTLPLKKGTPKEMHQKGKGARTAKKGGGKARDHFGGGSQDKTGERGNLADGMGRNSCEEKRTHGGEKKTTPKEGGKYLEVLTSKRDRWKLTKA